MGRTSLALTLAGAVLALLSSPAAAAMDVATFLRKAEELKRKGLAAPFSQDFKLVRAEMDRAMNLLEKERTADQAASRPTAYCPEGKPKLAREEIFAAMNAVPVSARASVKISFALRRAFARKYPCR